jgi:hypothetical protein
MRCILNNDVIDDGGPTVTDFLGKVFPHLETHLRCECPQILSTVVRPIVAHLASKSWLLWSRPASYVWAPVEDNLSAITAHLEHRNVSMEAIIQKIKLADEVSESYRLLLREILQCDEKLGIDAEEDKYSGFWSLPSLRQRNHRQPEHVIDALNNSNANKSVHAVEEAMHFNAPDGKLGKCEHNFPVNSIWCPGLAIITCTCSRKVVYAISFMDTGESPRTFFNMLKNRFTEMPIIIFYDNVRHMQQYFMHRDEQAFFKTRFLSDRFHESNHSTCCWRYRCSNNTDQVVAMSNTSAVEQVNNLVKTCTQRSVRWMTLTHAISYLTAFFTFFNAR